MKIYFPRSPDKCLFHASGNCEFLTLDHVKMCGAGGEGHVDPDAAVASPLINEGERRPRPHVPAPDIAHGVVLVNLVPYPANIAPGTRTEIGYDQCWNSYKTVKMVFWSSSGLT